MWSLLLACNTPSPETDAPPDPSVAVVDDVRTIGGCDIFPADNVWNRRVDALPLHPDSAANIAWLADHVEGGLKPGACGAVWEGSRCGIPWTVVPDGTPLTPVTFAGPWVWGEAGVPLPASFRIEGEPNPSGAWDRHVLLVDPAECVLHELINVRSGLGGWYADGAARWDLSANRYADAAWAAAEAAGVAMVPGIHSREEVETGHLSHALRVSLPIVGDRFTWPANHTDGRSSTPMAVPMGARLRLRADVNLDALGPSARVLATALQEYGAIVADTTGNFFALTGVPDAAIDDADLATLSTLQPSDFERVDVDPWQPEQDSLATR
jgi:hypothetical protein